MRSSRLIVLFLVFIITVPVYGQEEKVFTAEELKRYEEKVRDITNFYFYLLNTLGSKQTSPHEKEIIVTESYKKYFRDDEVQIEDDLDERREVPTNKKVSAYLKDVDFFFKDLRFEHEIKEVTQHVNENGLPYFKVALSRRLSGITVEDDTLNNTQDRFIEVNVTKENEALKIASVYTSQLSEKEDLVNWWNELSFGWKNIFRQKIAFEGDSLSFEDIKKVTAIKDLDIHENNLINSLVPLDKLTELEHIDISHTRIEDISPLRNLTRIKFLNASNTDINNIDALRYAFELERLYLNNTKIDSLEILENTDKLRILSISNTPINDLSPLRGAKKLQELYAGNTQLTNLEAVSEISSLEVLDVSHTALDSLPDLSTLKNLKVLNIGNTSINDISAASSLINLEEVRFENTEIDSLAPLADLAKLKKIYADYAGISREQAANFMAANPGTLILFASDSLFEWWKSLSKDWKDVLRKNFNFINAQAPSKEELASLTRIDSLTLSGANLQNMEAMALFHQLVYLDISNNNISDIKTLSNFPKIHTLDLSKNAIDDISILTQLDRLKEVRINELSIQSLEPFYGHKDLQIIFADGTEVNDEEVKKFKKENRNSLVIYKTTELKEWWSNLDELWKEAFKKNTKFTGDPDAINLHKVAFLDDFKIRSVNVTDIEPLLIMLSPTSIALEGIPVTDITPIHKITSLVSLNLTKMPLSDICPVKTLNSLEKLDLSDTPVERLEALEELTNLRELNLSSTQINNIKILGVLHQLEKLNIANTNVKRLKSLNELEQLEELICYNTKVSPKEVKKFKASQPQCRVVYYR